MAAGDTALWLHNKLGSTDDLWSGRSICSQLNREKLINIQDCFHALQSHVKWLPDLEEIISLGIHDQDPWVSTIGEVLREFPSSGALSLGDQDSTIDSSLPTGCVEEMTAIAKSSSMVMMPLECQYLNKTSLTAVAGQTPESSKHFTIKRRPKSAALRAEILVKSAETIQNKRNHAVSSVPIKARSFAKKMDHIPPLKSTPTRSPFGGDFRSSSTPFQRLNSLPRTPITSPKTLTPRSTGSKIKLLELDEMPVGAKEAKRRKRIADMEALEAQKKEKEGASSGAATSASSLLTQANYTPDYAAGLITPAAPKLPMTVLSVTSSALPQPSPAYLPTPTRQTKTDTSSVTIAPNGPPTLIQSSVKTNLSEQLKQQLLQPQVGPATIASLPVMAPILVSPTPPTTSTPVMAIQSQAVSNTAMPAQIPAQSVVLQPILKPAPALTPQLVPQHILSQSPQPMISPQPQLIPLAPQPVTQVPSQGVKKGLSLTKDQMIEAQEMFKASNKVSRPEKALILGFMAGSRENPCPQQGHVLSIKLSEKEELVQMSDGTVKKKIEDTYFQMNYATGEWKRFLKLREVAVS